MTQHRLEHYFAPSRIPSKPSGANILDLPYSVRQRIYEYAKLDGMIVDLNYSNLTVYPRGEYPETVGCRRMSATDWYNVQRVDVVGRDEVWETCEEFAPGDFETCGHLPGTRPYGRHQSMLLVCKDIHKEVESFTYRKNVFRVALGRPLGFTRLWRMSDYAISNLHSLSICLEPSKDICNDFVLDAMYYRPYPPTPVDLSTRDGQWVLKNWIMLLDRLKRLARPSQLSLYLIFRAKTIDDVKSIIDPMVQLPTLGHCGISVDMYDQSFWWLSKSKRIEIRGDLGSKNDNNECSRIVSKAIQQLTLIQNDTIKPFGYLDLPIELRFQILEHTDLVTPDPLHWRPRNFHPRIPNISTCEGHGSHTMVDEEDCRCVFEAQYLTKDIDKLYTSHCCRECRPNDYSPICYCSSRGRVWSTSCKCRLPRHPLFSVSSKVRQDAISLYYTRHKLVVMPYNSPSSRDMQCNDQLWPVDGVHYMPTIELSLYLSSIAPTAFQYIRWLEWVLPSCQEAYLLPKTRAWQDYLDTLLLMQNAMNLGGLTFTINFAALGRWTSCRLDRYQDYVGLAEDDSSGGLHWSWFETVVLPVQQLSEAGLKDFFVHFVQVHVSEKKRLRHERDLERLVMGKHYDSQKRGKPVERFAKRFGEQWQRKEEYRSPSY